MRFYFKIPCCVGLIQTQNPATRQTGRNSFVDGLTFAILILNLISSDMASGTVAHLLEAVGPGLHKGKAEEWSSFIIAPRGENTEGLLASVLVGIDGISKPELEFKYGPDKIFVRYEPTLPGDYRIEVTKAGADIPGSPFKVKIEPTNKPQISKVRVSGDGWTNPRMAASNEVIIDVSAAFILGKPRVSMQGKTFGMRKYGKPDILTTDEGNGVWRILYKPHFAGPYKLYLEFIEGPVPGSPFPLNVIDPNAPPAPPEPPVPVPRAGPRPELIKEKPRKVLFSLESLQARTGRVTVK